MGTAIRVSIPDSVGVAVQQLSLSISASQPLAAAANPSDTASTPSLTGTASLSGVVRGVGGLPLADAQLRVRGVAPVARSDTRGGYSLDGLPSGTQVLEVRRIGYLLGEVPVELRAGQTQSQDVRLQRIVTLDSIRVLAQRSRYREFEDHRKRHGFGKFLNEVEIERRHAFETSDLLRMIPGFRVVGYGIDAQVVTTRGVTSMSGPCEVNVVLDGMQHQDINLIHPTSIAGIEAYPAGMLGPMEYDGRCGLIVIWSKR
jgi:hypothetical protein